VSLGGDRDAAATCRFSLTSSAPSSGIRAARCPSLFKPSFLGQSLCSDFRAAARLKSAVKSRKNPQRGAKNSAKNAKKIKHKKNLTQKARFKSFVPVRKKRPVHRHETRPIKRRRRRRCTSALHCAPALHRAMGASPDDASASSPRPSLLVLYGSETGNAQVRAVAAISRRLPPRVSPGDARGGRVPTAERDETRRDLHSPRPSSSSSSSSRLLPAHPDPDARPLFPRPPARMPRSGSRGTRTGATTDATSSRWTTTRSPSSRARRRRCS
jgi:hypothetical protein